MNILRVPACLLFFTLCTQSVPLPIEPDTYHTTKLSKDDLKQALANYDQDTLKEIFIEAGVYDDNPQYDFKIRVASKESGTYSAHDEQRDGDVATGEYSYIDPTGALVKVNYTADNDGYHVDRHVQEGFVNLPNVPIQNPQVITAKPIIRITPRPQPRPTPRPQRLPTPRPQRRPDVLPITTGLVDNNRGKSEDYDLVARIIAQLTPHIKESVSTSLGGNGETKTLIKPQTNVPDFTQIRIEPTIVTAPPIISSNIYETKQDSEVDLVAKIIAQLTPHIRDSVSSSLGGTTYNQNIRTITPAQTPRHITSVNPIASTKHDDDQSIADGILAQLTPLIVANVRKSPHLGSETTIYQNGKQSSGFNTQNSDNELLEKILADLSPLITTNVRKSLGNSNYRNPLGSQTTVYQNGKPSSGFNDQISDNELVEKILAELSPFIEGAITTHFSNQNLPAQSKHDSGPAFYTSKGAGGEDKQFVNNLIAELLPTIQTLIRGQLGNE